MMDRILIVRLSAIGDTLLSVPVLCALRRAFPNAEIAWVTEPASAQLIRGHEALDRLFVVSKDCFKSPSAIWRTGRELRAWKPDVSIDLQGLTKSALLAWLSGARLRLGFQRQAFDGRELSTWLNNRLMSPPSEHMVQRGLDLLSLLGIGTDRIEYQLPEPEEEFQFAERVTRDAQIEGPYALINVGAGWVSKVWPSVRYAEVATHLWRHWGVPSLVVWSGDKEKQFAEEVVAASPQCASLAPATSLCQLRGLIRGACLFVGSDTGPMHLSVAVDTPTVGLIGPMPIERVGPLGVRHVGIQCDRLPVDKMRERKTNCVPMLSIQVRVAIQAVDQLMEARISRRRQNIA
jgi:lipopolysaccharide heptosyltransferase I